MPASRLFGFALAAGLLSALLFLLLAKGFGSGIVLSYVAPLPTMMVGLALGGSAVLMAVGVGMAAVTVTTGGISGLLYLAAAALPCLVVTNRSLLWRDAADGSVEWYPPGLVLAWLTALGLVLMIIGTWLVAGHPEGIKAWVTETIGQAVSLLAADVPADARAKAVEWWVPLFPAMTTMSWLMMAVLNAVGAQALLVRSGRNRRPTPAYRDLWLPDWPAALLAVLGLVGYAAEGDLGYVAANMAVVLTVPFVFLGLAGIHRFAAAKPNARFILGLVYALLILAFGWAVAAVAGLGMVRFWKMRFRRRSNGGGMEG
jgi:hypothetical protein